MVFNVFFSDTLSVMDRSVFPPNSCIEALTHNVTAFGDWSYTEIIKVKRGHQGETLIQSV